MFGNLRILAVIPARGGSKRIPKKNIYTVAGKPMIAWAIQSGLQSAYIDTVLVSTDSDEIKNVALNCGAQVPFLRTNYADDITPVSEATAFALRQAEELWGAFDVVIQLMPNCPLRTAATVDAGIEKFVHDGCLAQISYFKYGWMNPWWAHSLSIDSSPRPIFPDAVKSRSQDLEELYCPTGAIWIAKSEDLIAQGTFYAADHRAYIIDWVSALDIDDMNDLEMAEAAFKLRGAIVERTS